MAFPSWTDEVLLGAGAKAFLTARAAVDLDVARHVDSLFAAAKSLLVSGEAQAAWLVADRLTRLLPDREALPALLASAALAQSGHAEAARAALERAFNNNPDHPLVVDAALAAGDPDLRLKAAGFALHEPGQPHQIALSVLLAKEASAVVSAKADASGVFGRVFWRGERPPRLAWRDGQHSGRIETARAEPFLLGEEPASAEADCRSAEFAMPWPDGALALELAAEDEPAALLPRVLRRPFSPPVLPAAPGEGSGRIMIVVPVYGDFEVTSACFRHLLSAMPGDGSQRIVAIDDATPDPRISQLLDDLSATRRITLLRNALNLGFAASINAGLALRRPGEDAVLFNADTIVPQGAFIRLQNVAHAETGIGTVTPLSNNGEDTSIPVRFAENPLPTAEAVHAIDQAANAANRGRFVDIPNGVGFCLYVTSALLDRIGGLSGAFDRGYFEDVEFCLRARDAGFRNVGAIGVYVGHAGSRSFGAEKQVLIRRNLARLHAAYPGYRAQSESFAAQDPLAHPAERIAEVLLGAEPPPAIVLSNRKAPRHLILPLLAEAASGGHAMDLSLSQDTGGAFQLTLSPFPENRGGPCHWHCVDAPDALARLEAAGLLKNLRHLIIVDPPDIPEAIGLPLARRAGKTAVALRSTAHTGSGETDRRRLPEPIAGYAPPARAPVLALVTGREQAGDDQITVPLARALARHGGVLVLPGRDEADLVRMAETNIWVSGALGDGELAAWLRLAGVDACFFSDRAYGAVDPRMIRLRGSGCPIAYFSHKTDCAPADLSLPPARDEEAAIEDLVAWLLGRLRSTPDPERA